jgi:REP element-mobilizing transposase RayT
MENGTQGIFYRRRLPHYQPTDATFFVTSRLAGSLPQRIVAELETERRNTLKWSSGIRKLGERKATIRKHQTEHFKKFDSQLDAMHEGPRWLADDSVARVLADALHAMDRKVLDLLCFTIMPNHFHLLCALGAVVNATGSFTRDPYPLTRIMRLLKGSTARNANVVLHRTGSFWCPESYDHVIRDGEEMAGVIWYVLNNPVKAGLVESWEKWPWTYCKPGLI